MVGRPPLPVGTHGEIRTYQRGRGSWRAMTDYRDYDGHTRPVERHGRTKAIARARLLEAVRDRRRRDDAADITADSKFAAVAEGWYADVEQAVTEGRRSPNTARLYRGGLDKQILPALGELRIREVTVPRADQLVRAVRTKHGPGTAKAVRTILSGILGLATRYGLVEQNPVHDVSRIEVTAPEARSLSLDEAKDLRARVAADKKARGRDLPDFTDMMLATGLRIGETAAIVWPAVDFDAATVEVRGTVVRLTGKGLWIKRGSRASGGGGRSSCRRGRCRCCAGAA